MKSFLNLARLTLAVSLLGALAPLTARAQAGGPTYTVQAGDTLFAIANQFGTTVEALLAANPEVNPNFLGIGQALIIPGFEGITGALTVHAVELGESVQSVAVRFGVKRDTLIRLNHFVNPDLLYLDQALTLVDPHDGGAPVPAGVTYRSQTGLLALAASHNQNPWALAAANQIRDPGVLPPDKLIVIPGGDLPVNALPMPLRGLSVGPRPLEQGHTLSVHLQTGAALELTGSFGVWPLTFNADSETSHYALLGIYRLADTDLYRLTVTARDSAGHRFGYSQSLPVKDGEYNGTRTIVVDPQTIDPAVTVPELEEIEKIVAPVTPRRYWEGVFALPSVGNITAHYGLLRSYNGGPYDSFHTGTDFSGGDDRPITAPAPGKVVFTGGLIVRGNATIIDHGWGVYTGYWHQSKIEVQVGQVVETGQVIGYNGSTGRVTGPHLHWEVWVGGFQADPMQWSEVVFPQ
jgi:murein DD-endopeptidase MepM/ murein hydrolase activator NlpD